MKPYNQKKFSMINALQIPNQFEQAFLYLKETFEDLTRYSKFWQNWYIKYL